MDALILAGGENTRIPIPKGLLLVEGQRIMDRTMRLCRNIFGRIIISTNMPELYFYSGAMLVGDVLPRKGPMTGIYSVLSMPGVPVVFVTACDMPFINVILMQYLIGKWTGGEDAIIPVYRDKPEPLFGIYSARIAGVMGESIRDGQMSLQSFLGKINVHFVGEEAVRRRDPEGRSFVNINTLEDYQRETGGTECLG
jgi:molybdopterin-guanine dinucleotide biosynthesis protein A